MEEENWNKVDDWMGEYGDRIIRVVYLIINDIYWAEEITQEVFIRAYCSMNSFRQEASPYTWLYRIAINLARSHLRRQSRFRFFPFVERDGGVSSFQESLEDTVINNATRGRVKDCINELSFRYREVILLFYYEDMKIADIAQVLELPEGTIKSRLSRGRKELEKILRREGLDGERKGFL